MKAEKLFARFLTAAASGAIFAVLLFVSSAQAQSGDALCVLECAQNSSACFEITKSDSKTCALTCAALVKAEARQCRGSTDRRGCLLAAKELGTQCLAVCKDELNVNAHGCISAGELCVLGCNLPNQGCLGECRADFITCAVPIRDRLIGCTRDCKRLAAALLPGCRGSANPIECARDVWQGLVACHGDCRADAWSNLGTCRSAGVDCGRRCLANP